MEYDQINNLLLSEDNESEQLSKFVTREYVRVNSLLDTYNKNKSIRFKTPMLRSNLCDYSDAYILVKCTVTVNGVVNGVENEILRRNRPLILKNNAPFVLCMTKIINEFIEDADDLDIVMPMHNLLEYSKNYRKIIGSLYNYYRDELSDDKNPNNFPNTIVVNSNAFESKNKITGNTYNVAAGAAGHDANRIGKQDPGPPAVNGTTTGGTLAINNCKLYIPVVTLSKDDEIKLLTNLKSGFKREVIWNKYRSQMTTEAINNNLNILIDPTFTRLIDCLF